MQTSSVVSLPEVSIVIPVYNEEDNIGDVLKVMPTLVGDLEVSTLVVVDGGSDATAEILRPYVRSEVTDAILYHQDFQGRHYFHHFDMDPNLRDNYRDMPWYDLAERFADEWDQTSFDPDYPTEPLSHFEPKVRAVFATPHSI